MKTKVMLPSHTLNIVLSSEDIEKILDGRGVTISLSRQSTEMARSYFNGKDMERVDADHEHSCDLAFDISSRDGKPFEDYKPYTYTLQFLSIYKEKDES